MSKIIMELENEIKELNYKLYYNDDLSLEEKEKINKRIKELEKQVERDYELEQLEILDMYERWDWNEKMEKKEEMEREEREAMFREQLERERQFNEELWRSIKSDE